MIDVNNARAAWHAYVRDRQQRRQDHVAAVAAEAWRQAPDPIAAVMAGDAARVAAQAEFDAAEPELSYVEWKDSA